MHHHDCCCGVQPGLGCSLTPLPPSIFSERVSDTIRGNLEVVADHMGLDGYARIDAFAHIDSGEVIILEIDTTPSLTPFSELWAQVSTVWCWRNMTLQNKSVTHAGDSRGPPGQRSLC